MNLNRKLAWWGLVLGLACLLATGCGSPIMPPLPSTPSAAEGRLLVAVLTPMSGELSTFGEPVRNGIRLAIDEWNESGGAGGRPVEWILLDTGCDPDMARVAAAQAVEAGAHFWVGGVCSEAAIPIANVADQAGALLLSAAATHPWVTEDRRIGVRPTVFRAALAYPQQGTAAARFGAAVLDARRAAVVTDPDDLFVRDTANSFSRAFLLGGGQVVTVAVPTGSAQDFDPAAREIAAASPDLIYMPGVSPIVHGLPAMLAEQGCRASIVGSPLWESRGLDLSGLEGAYLTTDFSSERPDSDVPGWAERYLAAFSLEPDTLAASGYDAANLLRSAVEESHSTDPVRVAESLEQLEYQGVTGRWRYDMQHNPLKDADVLRVEDGQARYAGSAPGW